MRSAERRLANTSLISELFCYSLSLNADWAGRPTGTRTILNLYGRLAPAFLPQDVFDYPLRSLYSAKWRTGRHLGSLPLECLSLCLRLTNDDCNCSTYLTNSIDKRPNFLHFGVPLTQGTHIFIWLLVKMRIVEWDCKLILSIILRQWRALLHWLNIAILTARML